MVPPAMNTGMFTKVDNHVAALAVDDANLGVPSPFEPRPTPLRWSIEVFDVPIVIGTGRWPAPQNAFISFLFIFSFFLVLAVFGSSLRGHFWPFTRGSA